MNTELQHVLVFLDLDEGDEAIFEMVRILYRPKAPGKLIFVHAFPLSQKLARVGAEETSAEISKKITSRLEEHVEAAMGALWENRVECHFCEGSALNVLLELIPDKRPDLLVLRRGPVGSERANLPRRLARHITCPILVLTGREPPTMSKLLAPTDFSPGAAETMQTAMRFAVMMDVDEMTIMNVAPAFHGFPGLGVPYARMESEIRRFQESHLKAFIETLGEPLVRLKMRASSGDDVTETILKAVERSQYDCIVIGTRGTNSLRTLFLGSTTEAIIDASPVPVLVVPQAVPEKQA